MDSAVNSTAVSYKSDSGFSIQNTRTNPSYSHEFKRNQSQTDRGEENPNSIIKLIAELTIFVMSVVSIAIQEHVIS